MDMILSNFVDVGGIKIEPDTRTTQDKADRETNLSLGDIYISDDFLPIKCCLIVSMAHPYQYRKHNGLSRWGVLL